ncbi:MAG: hydrogenase large subunit [Solirubrobacteraceae bacterium]
MSFEPVAPARWRDAIAGRLATGGRFAGAWATRHDGALAWRAAFTTPGEGATALTCSPAGGAVATIADLLPAADWDEREAHDLYGLRFDGHDPLRALVAHPEDPAAWTTPVGGEGVHEVAVGPVHAGVIESGHFRFHVVGERILALDPRLFYKHRGLEHAAEGRTVQGALPYAQRACAGCAVTNTVAYAQAVEEGLGLWPDRDVRAGRTLLLELERLYHHLNDIGAVCAGVGFAPGAMAFAALKDRAQQLNLRLAGHRFLFDTIAVGHSALTLDAATADRGRGELRELRNDAGAAWRDLEFAGSVQARLDGVGVLGMADATRLGASGPAARAAGIRADARSESPRLAYEDFAPAGPREPVGDVAARLDVRAAELQVTCELLDELLSRPLGAGTAASAGHRQAAGIGLVESPRGATLAAVELDSESVTRLHLRTGSYANWPALAHATVGNLLPDFPLINKSFELCYACVDR